MPHGTSPRDSLPSRRVFLAALGAATVAACSRKQEGTSQDVPPAIRAPLMPPADLNARLEEVRSGRIVVLHVGPQYLWGKGHIPGSRWVGEAGTEGGLAALEAALKAIPPDIEVVAYCGCCPFSHCPNIQPARQALAGRAKASFLDLPTNLRTDWIEKGFAVERT